MLERVWNFLKEFSWPFGMCGGIYAIASRFIDTGDSVNTLVALAILVFLLALIICISGYVIRGGTPSKYPEIKVQQAREGGRLLITKTAASLGMNMAAMIYVRDGSYERVIGMATVLHVQTDGLTQLTVNYVPGLEPEIRSKISENVLDTLRNIIIRPGIHIQSSFPVEVLEQ